MTKVEATAIVEELARRGIRGEIVRGDCDDKGDSDPLHSHYVSIGTDSHNERAAITGRAGDYQITTGDADAECSYIGTDVAKLVQASIEELALAK